MVRILLSTLSLVMSRISLYVGRVLFRRSGVRKIHEGKAPPSPGGKCLCIFAHYSKKASVDGYVVHYLEALKDFGADIIFVSANPELSQDEIEKIQPLCRTIMIRRNVGYDFGSWKVGLEKTPNLETYEQLILANDSVYGPLFPLGEVFQAMGTRDNVDFWGITDSWHPNYHLQSYFLALNRSAFMSRPFKQFWRTLPYLRSKRDVINNAEVRLTPYLARRGLRSGVYCPYGSIEPPEGRTVWEKRVRDLALRHNLNPGHFFWKTLIEKHRCPFLKVELLVKNPARVQDLHSLDETISSRTEYRTNLIYEHLAQLAETRLR
jgi:lipopolysaccharide biosynthesis protein